MSLIKCPECQKEISDKAEKCISCGYPIKTPDFVVKFKTPTLPNAIVRVNFIFYNNATREVLAKAQQIAIEYNLPYRTVKGKLFKRLYKALNDYYEVATYRELPSIKYEDIIDTIKGLSIYIRDIQEEEYQLSF